MSEQCTEHVRQYPWRDEELMREMYLDKVMTTNEIADELDCSNATISTWLKNHDIETRTKMQSNILRDPKPYEVTLTTSKQGYVNWYKGQQIVAVHRLLAVAEFGFDAVADMDVHHKSECKWDNRPDNLELLSHGEHNTMHKMKVTGIDRLRVAEMYEHGDISSRKLAKMFDIASPTVLNIHKEFFGEASS